MSKSTVTQPVHASTSLVQLNNPPHEPHRMAGAQHYYWRGKLLAWSVRVAVLLIAALLVIPALLQKWLWMRQLNYAGIFWTLLSIKWGMTSVAFIGAFLFLWINIRRGGQKQLRAG